MDVLSFIPDHRISASNVLLEMKIKDYIKLAKNVLDKNEYQRRKVIKSSLQESLKSDLLKGCSIPPITLAVRKERIPPDFDYLSFNDPQFIIDILSSDDILILDGLQRTYVILELDQQLMSRRIDVNPDLFYNQTIRFEIYVGLQKVTLLYRMLTLNTGQTTMSTRHLMEILYLDYLNEEIDGIKIIPDKESIPVQENTSEFRFKEILDGYYSFIEGTEVPLERADILDNIQTIKELERTDEDKEGFQVFVKLFKGFLDRIILLSEGFEFNDQSISSPELELTGPPFGNNALSIFKKSQSLTGFGSALNFLRNRRNLSFEDINHYIDGMNIERVDSNHLFNLLNKYFDYIRNKSKKVGNDQRYFFKVLFQNLFDPESEYHLKIDLSAENAYRRIKERIEG